MEQSQGFPTLALASKEQYTRMLRCPLPSLSDVPMRFAASLPPSGLLPLPNLFRTFSLWPAAPVDFALSDPAKSTRLILETMRPTPAAVCPSPPTGLCVMHSVRTACERLDAAFICPPRKEGRKEGRKELR